VSQQSHLLANDKDNNKVKLGAVRRFPGIYLMPEEKTPKKPQLEDHPMKTVQPVITSNEIPYLQIRLVGLQGTSGRQKEGKKKRTR
jgi:hypothetical protein